MKRFSEMVRQLLRGRDRGTVAVTFALSLPILLTLIGILVQYAMLANAQLTVDRAVYAGARAAMTALPTDQGIGDPGGEDFVRRSILMTLEALSPASPELPSAEAVMVADAIEQIGGTLPDRYVQRYTYAQGATTVEIMPLSSGSYAQTQSPRVRLTVRYDFQIKIPLVNLVIGKSRTVAGVTGRFRTMTSTVDVQLSPGREAGK